MPLVLACSRTYSPTECLTASWGQCKVVGITVRTANGQWLGPKLCLMTENVLNVTLRDDEVSDG